MYFLSTRNAHLRQPLSSAILEGLAQDGGLYVPEVFPQFNWSDLPPTLEFPEMAELILKDFFAGDALEMQLNTICRSAFNFPLPLKTVAANTYLLELFQGPTLSFKDFGARFLAECLNLLPSKHKTTVLVATSGDTGSAVAAAFYLKDKIDVLVLYPKGKISDRQEHQIACWGDNVLSLAVRGTFDDCQRLVKRAFHDASWKKHRQLTSANSINLGRLLPQITYYAYTALQFFRQHQEMPGFIVPTGNLGNATAAFWAKQMGFPIREIVLATNANRVIEDYLETGEYEPRPSIATLANAMDVGDPSNFERLSYLFNSFEAFKDKVKAFSATDKDIRHMIKKIYKKHELIVCPHTATAFFAKEQLPADKPWIVVATADASKFETIIEPIIGKPVPIPQHLQTLLNRPMQVIEVDPSLEEIQKLLS